jgi:hypothetical protein
MNIFLILLQVLMIRINLFFKFIKYLTYVVHIWIRYQTFYKRKN